MNEFSKLKIGEIVFFPKDKTARVEINALDYRVTALEDEEAALNTAVENLESSKQDNLVAGANITIENNTISANPSSVDEVARAGVDELRNSKQDTLTAGANITIENNVISSSDSSWKLAGSVTGTTHISVPSNMKELSVLVLRAENAISYSLHFSRGVLASSERFFGFSYNNNTNGTIKASLTTIYLNALIESGTNFTNSARFDVYWR